MSHLVNPLNQVQVVHAAYRAQYEAAATTAAIQQTLRNGVAAAISEAPQEFPPILLQAVIEVGDRTNEGHLVRAVAIPWVTIVQLIQKEPRLIYELDWRRWEEIVAGAWKQLRGEVTLTPRSGDGGRDIIITFPGIGRVRLIDQVKRYKPGHLVTANDVRAMLGVLYMEPNVSKGFITTTSEFAPGIWKDSRIQKFMPDRLELRSKERLLTWLQELANVPLGR